MNIYETLDDSEQTYEAAIKVLDAHFKTKINPSVERHKFRSLVQESSESIQNYVTRLKKAIFLHIRQTLQ